MSIVVNGQILVKIFINLVTLGRTDIGAEGTLENSTCLYTREQKVILWVRRTNAQMQSELRAGLSYWVAQ